VRRAPSGVRPGGDDRLGLKKVIEEMAAGKPCGARDQRRTRHGRESATARAVLAVVVRAERWIRLLALTPPPVLLPVPGHRPGKPGVERDPRPPAKRLDLARVERVPAVVPGAIGNRTDERVRLAYQAEDAAREIDVPHLVASADVVDLARRPRLDDEIER